MNNIKLKLHKRELDFTFGVGFLGEVLEELDIDLAGLLAKVDKNPFKTIPFLAYKSAKYSLELDGKEADFTLREITHWIDLDGAFTQKNKSMIKFIQELTKSIVKDVPVEEIEVNDAEEVVADSKKK